MGRGTTSSSRVLRALCATVFVDLLGFTLVLPSLPFYVARLGGGGVWLGVLLTGYSLAQSLAAPLLGRLADRHGRRLLLLLSLAGSTVSLLVMGLAGSLLLLLGARLVAGVCGGSIGVSQAFAADVTAPAECTKVMGWIGAATGLAFTIGPALGALAAPLGFGTVASVAAGLAAVNFVFAWVTLPGAGPGRTRPSGNGASRRLVAPWPLLVVGFTGMVAFVSMETTVALLAGHRFGAGPGFVGLMLCLAGLALVVVQGVGIGAAARRWGETRVAASGAMLMTLGLLVLPVVPVPVFVAAVVLLSVGYGLTTAIVAGMLATSGPAEQRGARMGQGQSAAAVARAVGPLSAGALFDLTAWLPYVIGAGLGAAAAIVLSLQSTTVHNRVSADDARS
ncbi:MAG: MFS transporter [Pseudonocardiaceae bacterium]